MNKPWALRQAQKISQWILGYLPEVLVVAVVAGIWLSNLLWLSRETRPPHWDMARHLYDSLLYYDYARGYHPFRLVLAYNYYPPLLYWLVIPMYAIFGKTNLVAVAANIIYLVTLAGSTYATGRYLWSRWTGVLAAILTLGLPMFVSQFKEYQLDAPLSAIIALSLYLLIRTEAFARRKFSLLLGASIGIGMLTKWTFIFILGLPLFYGVVSGAFYCIRQKSYARLINIAYASFAALLISGPWYLHNLNAILRDLTFTSSAAGSIEGDPILGSLASNTWYLRNLADNQLYLVPLVLLIIGCGIMLTRRANWERNKYPALLAIGCLVFFTFLQNKDARYTLPLLSSAMIIATFWFSGLPRRVQLFGRAGIFLYSAVAFVAISFGTNLLPPEIKLAFTKTKSFIVFAQHGYIIGPPSHENWHQREVMEALSNDQSRDKTFTYLGPDTIWYNHWATTYYSKLYSLKQQDEPSKSTYIITRTPVAKPNQEAVVLKQFQLPDKSILTVYKRIGAIK